MSAVPVSITLLTADVPRLVSFYKRVLDRSPASQTGELFATFEFPQVALSIWSRAEYYRVWARAPLASGFAAERSAEQVGNFLIDLKVEDVQREHDRLIEQGVEIVKGTTTQAWGNTSFWVRDPDGNLLNFRKGAPEA